MDPIYQVRKVLVESYFTISNIFQVVNQVDFIFNLSGEDLNFPVEIRGVKPKQVALGYPMTASFFINA
jgi:hypothetical protein